MLPFGLIVGVGGVLAIVAGLRGLWVNRAELPDAIRNPEPRRQTKSTRSRTPRPRSTGSSAAVSAPWSMRALGSGGWASCLGPCSSRSCSSRLGPS